MKPYKAIVVSDLHLGTKDSKAEEFLEFIDKHPTELLILNGDIVDAWAINRGSKWKKHHTKVLGKILKLSNKIQVVWIRGNHDEFITEFIGQSFGGVEFREDYTIQYQEWIEYDHWENRCYYVFHGDVIDVFITKYKWLAKIGSIGYDLALWLNRVYNKYRAWRKLPYQSISQKIKEGVKNAVSYVNDFEVTAIRMAEKKGCNGVICGHIHQPKDRIIDGKRYVNSGDWVENMSAVLIDHKGAISIYQK
jgi:UDP-2,3-diacylglucosamine pyrophosphatase LpxH